MAARCANVAQIRHGLASLQNVAKSRALCSRRRDMDVGCVQIQISLDQNVGLHAKRDTTLPDHKNASVAKPASGVEGPRDAILKIVSKSQNRCPVMLSVVMVTCLDRFVGMTVIQDLTLKVREKTFAGLMVNGLYLKLPIVLSVNVHHLIHLFLVILGVQVRVSKAFMPLNNYFNSLFFLNLIIKNYFIL